MQAHNTAVCCATLIGQIRDRRSRKKEEIQREGFPSGEKEGCPGKMKEGFLLYERMDIQSDLLDR